MKEIVKVLLQEGIDESMINRVLDLIEEEYDVINELDKETIKSYINKRIQQREEADKKFEEAKKSGTASPDELRKLLYKELDSTSKAQKAMEKGGQALHYSAKERQRSKRNMEQRKG